MEISFVDLNAHPFCIRQWGDTEKPPLLLLHGFPEFGGAWAELAALLSDHFFCIAPDQRGYGQSWTPEGTAHYTVSQLVSDVAALAERMGAPVTVLGHDWGASVAYGLAMFRPELVARLIIANGVHPVPFQRALAAGGAQSEASQYISRLRAADAAAWLSADNFYRLEQFFRHAMGTDWLSEQKMSEYRTEWARPGRLEAMLNWYRASPLVVAQPGQPRTDLPELPIKRLRVTCPHLLLWGPEDKALLPVSTDRLEDFAPNLTRITIAGTDHWLHHQNPQAVAAAILTWIDPP